MYHMNILKKIIYILVFSGPIFAANNAYGAKLKIGVLAPDGTSWSKNFKKMAKEIKEKTNNDVKIKFYFGGVQGDEADVLRKIRAGQLHGGVFTGKTLGEINGDIRVMELPFTFMENREKAFSSLQKMAPVFNKGLTEKKFKNLGFFELGLVYFVSLKKVESLNKLTGIKIWSWAGDELVAEMIKSMNLISVPLALPDVLSSLSTGIIEAAYGPPMGILALQWNTKIKYLVDFPMAYSVGAFLLSEKGWKKVAPKHRPLVEKIAKKYVDEINISILKDNKDALLAMKNMGIQFLKFPAPDLALGKTVRKKVIAKLQGKLFSKSAFSKLEQITLQKEKKAKK